MGYTQEQIDRANQVNLEQFLRSQGEQLIKSGQEFRWKAHDSLTVKGNRWFRHSQSKGGYPITFVMEFYGKTFPEAVEMLLGEKPMKIAVEEPAKAEFRLPVKNENNDTVVSYLTEERKISIGLVEEFIKAGFLYEDTKHNVVFVGRDENGVPRYAHCRGTTSTFKQDVLDSDKSCGFHYYGGSEMVYVFESVIDMMSYITIMNQGVWKINNYVSLGGVSAKALEGFLKEHSNIKKVLICTDTDKAGTDALKTLSKVIPDHVEIKRIECKCKDWNETLCTYYSELAIDHNSFSCEEILQDRQEGQIEEKFTVPMIRMSEVEQTEVEWLWYPYIPFGKLTIIQGNPGEGKTFFAMQLAAACTNRKYLPQMEEFEPFNMIFQTSEDGLGDTVKPRLLSAKADLDRVLVIDDSESPLTLSDGRIESAIRENQARLVIIDPLQAFLGADVDMNRANKVRPVFRKLADIAQATGCAIVMIGHLNKASGTQSTYRGLGSIDITAVVRSLLFIGKVKKDPTTRVIVHEKSSLAPPGQSLAFSLGDEKGFQWIGAYDISAEDLLAGGEGNKTELKQEQAVKLIYEFLSEGKEASVAEINKEAIERGISERTVRLARNSMKDKLESERRGKDWWIWLKRQESDEPAKVL